MLKFIRDKLSQRLVPHWLQPLASMALMEIANLAKPHIPYQKML